jgi:hypothetical protein
MNRRFLHVFSYASCGCGPRGNTARPHGEYRQCTGTDPEEFHHRRERFDRQLRPGHHRPHGVQPEPHVPAPEGRLQVQPCRPGVLRGQSSAEPLGNLEERQPGSLRGHHHGLEHGTAQRLDHQRGHHGRLLVRARVTLRRAQVAAQRRTLADDRDQVRLGHNDGQRDLAGDLQQGAGDVLRANPVHGCAEVSPVSPEMSLRHGCGGGTSDSYVVGIAS